MKSRRALLRGAAVGAVTLPVLGQQHEHSAADQTAVSTYKPKWATPLEMKQIAALCDVIIPPTDTPGASDAKVHEYIDYALAASKQQQDALRDGLKWFFAIAEPDRTAALQKASENARTKEGRFFRMIRDLTLDGYYQSKQGLEQELGWHGLTYLPKFDGCTHPEHKG